MTSTKYNIPADFDLSDIPQVREQDLALVMQVAIEAERSLILMRGVTPADKRVIEDAFWTIFDGSTAQGVVTLVRFWCLVEAFSTKRFHALLLNRGFELIGPAVAAAAKLRLNVDWGFNPQRLFWAIEDARPSFFVVGAMSPNNQPSPSDHKLAA